MAKAGFDIRVAPSAWADIDCGSMRSGWPRASRSIRPRCMKRIIALDKEVARMVALGWRKGHVPPIVLQDLTPFLGFIRT